MRYQKVFLTGMLVALPLSSWATMYRSNYSGEFGILDPDTAAFTVLGTLASNNPLSGICLDQLGQMWGTERNNTVTSLITIDASTGAQTSTIGAIKVGATNLKITDLACQPGSGNLFGLDNGSPANLYKIDRTTAAATLVGTTEVNRGGLGFSRDGRLFAATIGAELAEIDPTNAKTIGQVINTGICVDGFAVRPSDNVGFATECDDESLYRINLSDGSSTEVGQMGDYGADVEFSATKQLSAPATSPLTLAVIALLLGGWALRHLRHRSLP